MMPKQEGLHLMTTFSFSCGKEQIAVELLTWRQTRQGQMICLARDKPVRKLHCNMAQRNMCVVTAFQQVVKTQQNQRVFSKA